MAILVIDTNFAEIFVIQRRDMEEEEERWIDWSTPATEHEAEVLRDNLAMASGPRWDWRAVRKIILTVTTEV
jgi:hypothetical protein